MSLAKTIAPDIEELIREKPGELAAAVADLHPADVAELLEDLPREDRLVLFEALPPEQGAAVLSELKGETLRLVLHQASLDKLGPQLDRLPGDEVVFLLEHLSQRRRENLLGRMSPRDAAEAKRPDRKVGELLDRRVATVRTDTPQEEVAQLVSKYDVYAIPVVDEENRPVGIVTVDDVIDVLNEEQTEDVLHMAGVSAEEEPEGYFARSAFRNVRLRFNWLLLLFATETLTGTVLRHFQDELSKVVALSFFIPLLIGTGGNSGSQTVTTIVRGLAVGEIRLRDFGRVFAREAGSGLVLGLLLGVVGFGRALLWGSTTPLALTVGVSILAICTWANAVGASIPMAATLFKIDPTVMSAPLIATLVDATGLFIYFAVARIFLGL